MLINDYMCDLELKNFFLFRLGIKNFVFGLFKNKKRQMLSFANFENHPK